MDHTDVLNALIERHGLKRYLEIGVQNPKNNFDKIKAPKKVGVDPVKFNREGFVGTSDEFFDNFRNEAIGHYYCNKYDIIFIDGLHHADQVHKDFMNSMNHLHIDGFIVLHDTLPESEHLTHVPRDKRGRWLGDVYKFVMWLNLCPDYCFYTLPFDNGITVVWRRKDNDQPVNNDLYLKAESIEVFNWDSYTQNQELMRILPQMPEE